MTHTNQANKNQQRSGHTGLRGLTLLVAQGLLFLRLCTSQNHHCVSRLPLAASHLICQPYRGRMDWPRGDCLMVPLRHVTNLCYSVVKLAGTLISKGWEHHQLCSSVVAHLLVFWQTWSIDYHLLNQYGSMPSAGMTGAPCPPA